MKFCFTELIIWLKNGKTRTLTFVPNKINIVTGDSNTGKTAILDIIDYCLFASRHKISDSMINENIEWYGIRFNINDKCYLLARRAPNGNVVSTDYYFSSTGEIPKERPVLNNTEATLKNLLEAEFSIDRDTKVSYGGKTLKANSRISLRYFLVLNTMSQDIITHSEEYFDKQKSERYREALPRTFDLAVGIDTVENILKREKREDLEREAKKLEREAEKVSRKQGEFHAQLAETVRTAKEYALVPENSDIKQSISFLKGMVASNEAAVGTDSPQRYREISAEINEVGRKIRNIHRFSGEYRRYKNNLQDADDSLKPIEYLAEHHEQIIKTSIFDDVVSALKSDHLKIKRAIVNKTPLDGNVSDIVKEWEGKLRDLIDQRALLPKEVKAFEDDKRKFMFIGETKAKLDLYEDDNNTNQNARNTQLENIKTELAGLIVDPPEERRALFVKVLDETIQDYISETGAALENYATYKSSFNYEEKKLQLRKPKTDFIESVGSSSNHMFLHLFLFLGLHELIIKRKAPYVPPFLIIDQFSRPYWGDDKNRKKDLTHTDISKVKAALKLLNGFMQSTIESGAEFQMIVFEHINESLWADLPHVHLVEVFKDGNALIPEKLLASDEKE